MTKFLRSMLIRLGVPEGQSPLFYRDVVLSLPFIFGSLIAIFLGFEGKFSPVFWVCLVIALSTLLLATKRRALICGLILFSAVRFVVVFVLTRRGSMLLAAGFCALIGYAMAVTDKSDYPDAPS